MTANTQDLGIITVDITVHRARDLPDLKTFAGNNREFYVTIVFIDGSTKKKRKKKTRAVQSSGNAVDWEEKLETLYEAFQRIQPLLLTSYIHTLRSSSPIYLTLCFRHRIASDIVIGTVDIDPVARPESPFRLKTNSGSSPIVVLAVYVHGTRISQETNVLALPEPSVFEQKPIPAFEPPPEPKPGHQLSVDVRTALDNADDALTRINVYDEWKGAVENVQWLMQAVKDVADIHPYTEVAWTILSAIPEIFLSQFERDENIQMLAKTMRETFDLSQAEDLLKAIKSNSNQALILKVMLKHITICSDVIQRYAKDKEFVRRLFRNITGGISDDIQGLCDTLTKLKRDFLDNAIINMQIAVHLIQQSMNVLFSDIVNLDFDAKINDLPYRSGWSSTGNKSGCLEGTRADFLEYILDWISEPSSLRGLILFGKLGTGKSSIAFEIASRFCFENRPGSYFSFARAQKSKQTDHHLFTTIIRDMSERYPSFKLALGKLITNNTPLRTSDDFDQLFNILLLGPLETVRTRTHPDLIVIDGLDESGDSETLAKFLTQCLKRLPPNFRVLITSRSEGDIETCFRSVRDPPYKIIHMDDIKLAARLDDDIRLYFRTRLSPRLFDKYGVQLVERANGLFQWAAVACGHLTKRPAGYTEKDCIRGLLSQNEGDRKFSQGLTTNLYNLYMEVLSAHFTLDKWPVVRPRFCSVLGQLLSAFEPLSINTLTDLRRFITDDENDDDDEAVHAVVECMGSLLSNVTSENHNLPVVPLHTSFRDFLTDDTNLHNFSIKLMDAHKELTHACLSSMLHELKFNICKLESSHLANGEVGDLQSRINTFISPALFYSSRFWDDHLCYVPFTIEVLDKLDLFYSTKFLAWLEVLSITQCVPLAVKAIMATLTWLQNCLDVDILPRIKERVRGLIDLVGDGMTFLRSFGKIVARSAPHIYVSALPFAPLYSEIYKTYSTKFPPMVSFTQGQLLHWPAVELSISSHSLITCVEFSPDGQWIASALTNGSICLWNSTTGLLEGTRFIGHTKPVSTIAFSPNGQHILSGSYDRTVRLWNVATGDTVGEAWTGHEDSVNSVTFSPDGCFAASASRDRTVRIWDVAKGSTMGTPLTLHTNNVRSVAFSRNGEKIVSGSEDFTVRVWIINLVKLTVEVDPLTLRVPNAVSSVAFSPDSQQVAVGCFNKNVYVWDLSEPTKRVPLKGHTFSVNSVKFSPDGQYIVSGSTDGKLLLWNATTKMVEGSPLVGPTGSVRSIAFSPDGQRIVSAADSTIQVWNAAAAKRGAHDGIIAPTGHVGPVTSVAFSPIQQDRLIASGSDDHTVCLWDIYTGQISRGPLRGLIGQISSLSFSPDGRKLVSASADTTLRIWDLDQRSMEGVSFVGHTSAVCSVSFSPDGQKIVSGSLNGEIFLWDVPSRTIQERMSQPIAYSSPVLSVGFSPNGKQVVAGPQNGAILFWDVLETGTTMERDVINHDAKMVVFVTFLSQREQILSCFIDGTACFWDTGTRQMQGTLFSLLNSSQGYVTSISLSSDDSLIAVGSPNGTIDIWSSTTHSWQNTLHPLIGHTAPESCPLCCIFVPRAPSNIDHDTDTYSNIDLSRVNDEGWIQGNQGELVLWVPQVYRPALRRPGNTVAVISPYPIRLDFSRLTHGLGWHVIYSKDLS